MIHRPYPSEYVPDEQVHDGNSVATATVLGLAEVVPYLSQLCKYLR